MIAFESERKWKFTVLLLEVFLAVCVIVSDSESGIVEWVSRRQSGDIYYFINSSYDTCDQNKSTYLISENQCVKDEELFRECAYAVVPAQSPQLSSIAAFDSPIPNIIYLSTNISQTVGDSITYNNETFKFNGSNQLVNNSLCEIFSLEVYRGREQAFKISHEGFCLSDNGNIVINTDQLGYDLEGYVGELYRMNLSCSGGGLPESGCLFFKVRVVRGQGNASVTNAKFNCTVPGIFLDFTEECNVTTMATILSEITSTTTATTSESHIITSINGTASDSGSEVFYVLAGLGGGILILTFCIVIMCIYFGFMLAKRRGMFIVTAVSPHSMYTVDDEQPQQQHDAVREENDELPTTTLSRTILSDSILLSEDSEHVYAVLEQPQQQSPNVIQLDEITEQDQQSRPFLERVPSNGFQAKQKSRSAIWTSAEQSKVGPKPRNVNLELIPICDNVTIANEGQTIMDIDNGPSHPGKSYRKHSLPAKLSVNQLSDADSQRNCPVSNGSDTQPKESILIYSRPDMNRKKEERQKKRQQEERMAALRNISSPSCPPLTQLTESEQENIIVMNSNAVFVDWQQQQQPDADLKFGKQFDVLNHTPDDKAVEGSDECIYDEPISLNLAPKKCKNTTERKKEGNDEKDYH